MKATVAITGADRLLARLDSAAERSAHLAAAHEAAIAVMERSARARFNFQGPGWAELAPSTQAGRDSQPILQQTGALLDSVTDSGDEHAIRNVTAYGIEFGTSVEYATFHQRGTSRMPARPFFRLGTQATASIARVYRDHIFGGIA